MLRTGGLQFNLYAAVTRINIIELLLSRCAEIGFGYGVQRLFQMYDGQMLLNDQPHLVETARSRSANSSSVK